MDWQSTFALSIPPLEGFVRGTVTYLMLLALLRVVGQRESGGLGITDVLLVVLVADAASAGLRGEAGTVADSAVLVVTILFWSVVVDAVDRAYIEPNGMISVIRRDHAETDPVEPLEPL